ncbi:DMT family transporter [Zoogloea sp.]|uniref:DMT family transporter n=1 Tax=Zoogloea sp. TaxID=49181 RepID=UPI00141580FE|nr:MAG: DMT family transporter [Zoogloea sp.]
MIHFHIFRPGVAAALGAALLFGAGTPLAKLLLRDLSPFLLAGLFYLGSGVGLSLFRGLRGAAPVRLARGEAGWLAGAVLAGGVAGPVLLMLGLAEMPASGASLLLNAEGVLTALLAWIVFKENFDRRIALGMAAIASGAAILSWPAEARFAGTMPALLILAACLAWGIDNNLTRKVSLADASWIATVKGLAAGTVNLALAFALGERLPAWPITAAAMAVGFLAYGVSLVLFVIGLRHLGTARTGAYFSIAPFFGAALALAGGEALTLRLSAAGLLMGIGIWLHLTEQHAHVHAHEPMEHTHEHTHDDHHQHGHDFPVTAGTRHTHLHRHEPLVHGHPHFPDAHHQGHRH